MIHIAVDMGAYENRKAWARRLRADAGLRLERDSRAKRRRKAIAAACVVLVSIVATIGVFTWF